MSQASYWILYPILHAFHGIRSRREQTCETVVFSWLGRKAPLLMSLFLLASFGIAMGTNAEERTEKVPTETDSLDQSPAGEPKASVSDERTVGQFTVRLLTWDNQRFDMEAVITKNGVEVFSARPDAAIFFTDVPDGDDINGDGIPDLVLGRFTGGAHCCNSYLIISLDEPVSVSDKIIGAHSEVQFEKQDDGYRVRLNDWTFAYWNMDFAGSPSPEVILKYEGNKLVVDKELMKTAPRTGRVWVPEGSCKEVSVKAVLHKKAIVCSDLGSLTAAKVRKEQNDDQAQ